MKLHKNKKINSRRLFELQLIKSKMYTHTKKKHSNKLENDLSGLLIDFKKSINIIFKYHKNNKRILFIGSPQIFENLINSKTIHTAMPDFLDFRNKLTINSYISKTLKLNKHLFNNKNFLLSKLKKKPELIVMFNHIQKESVIKETTLAKIPIIEFNANRDRENWSYNYAVQGSMNINKNKTIDNIFYIILNSLFSNRR